MDEIAWAIIPGIIFNLFGYLIINGFTNYKIDLSNIGYLLTSVNDSNIVRQIFSDINNHLLLITMYFIVLWGLSVMLGHLTRILIRWRKWDRKYHWLRFSNEWYYFFSREYVEISGDERLENIDFMISEVLADIGGGQHILYIGYVTDFFMSKDGGLDSIYLKYPIRKKYSIENAKGHEIGDLLMIPFNTIINISIRYMKIEPEKDIEDKTESE